MLPLLTRDETCALAKLARAGDIEARNELIVRNQALVPPIAQGYRGRGLDMDDLIGEGNLGLFPAIAGFDPANGAAFSTYATWWIKNAIRKALADQGRSVRVPQNIGMLVARVNQAEHTGVTFDEIAALAGWPESTKRLILAGRQASSKQTTIGWMDWVEASPADPGDGLDMGQMLRYLDARSAAVVKMRMGLEDKGLMSPDEIALVATLSPKYVKKVFHRAIQRLRRMFPLRSMARPPA